MSIPPQPLSILIVDDHAEMRHLIRSMLTGLGAQVNECNDGSQALAAYREHIPDWVLMDIRMKELSGIDATRQLRAAFPEARVIIVSEISNAASRKAAREAGACAYVLKEDLLSLPAILRQTF
jgi:two-component system response regulator DegU